MLYKPGVLISVLGITREQFRYWRRELDPIPSRPVFHFQILLAYAVIKELIIDCWLEPRNLKRIDMREFFNWFETRHEPLERAGTVVEIDKKSSKVTFRLLTSSYHAPTSQARVETIFLKTVEENLISRFRDMD